MRHLLALLMAVFFFSSCRSNRPTSSSQKGKWVYSYTDVSGTYQLEREQKIIKNQVVTRSQLLSMRGGQKVLEKSVTVSEIGSIKSRDKRLLTVRPLASDFTVWLEGKQYSSRMRLNPGSRSMTLTLDSPEPKWQGKKEVPFPKGKYFCFFSQLPECLHHNLFLENSYKSPKRKFNFYIVWDSFPYIQEQLTQVGNELFSVANLKFDGEIKKKLRYIVEVEGQIILFNFSRDYELSKIAWISQGITIVPPGEEVSNDEQ